MDVLVPLPVALPLFAAAVLAAVSPFVPAWFGDLVAAVASSAVTVIGVVLLTRTGAHDLVYWFGGWRPSHGVALGIAFDVDGAGAAMAALAAFLMTASVVFSWRYFDETGPLFHVLLLVFLGAVEGFALSGDLFNLFVFLELMTVAAIALTGYGDEPAPLQGALNFGIVNGFGAFFLLFGIGLLYSRTGALNLAQIGQALAGHPADMLIVVALLLVLVGLLVKAAVVPLHFWLADAYTVAPIPVCVLFSGAMTELGLYAFARVYWTVFSSPVSAHAGSLRDILIWMGVISALVGAVMCFAQHHLKRLLAFSTVSHVGIFLIGIALFSHLALAGTAAYVVAHGFAKAALFMGVGIMLHRFGTVDEYELRGRGRELPGVAAGMFVVGGLVLAAAPMLGTFFGKSLIDESALTHGYWWLPAVLVIAAAVTGGAVLRAAGRVFGGYGPAEPHPAAPQEHEGVETVTERDHTPATMLAPAAVLTACAVVVGLVPGVVHAIEHASQRFMERGAYAATVLHGAHPRVPTAPPSSLHASDFIYASLSLTLALALAWAALSREPLSRHAPRALMHGGRRALAALRALHSGHVGDYVAWLTFAVATLGGLFALTLR